MPANTKSDKKELVEPSNRIAKTKQKLLEQNDLFLDFKNLNPKEKKDALKRIGNWIALHHNLRENLTSQNMDLFKNNEESAEPSKTIQQMHKVLQDNFKKQK